MWLQVPTGIAAFVTTLSELPGHMWCSPNATRPSSKRSSYPRLPASIGALLWWTTTARGACSPGGRRRMLRLNGSAR